MLIIIEGFVRVRMSKVFTASICLMFQKIREIIGKIEEYPLTFSQFLLSFSVIISVRMLGENFLMGFGDRSFDFFVGSFLAAFLFFLFSFLLIVLFLSQFLKESPRKMANILLWGFWIVVTPPFVDRFFCRGSFCWSFFAFDSLKGLGIRFLTFFGDNPPWESLMACGWKWLSQSFFSPFSFFLKPERRSRASGGASSPTSSFFFSAHCPPG
jgi:hypothetical protein